MTNKKIEQTLQNLENALQRLEEALNEPSHNSLIVDGTIQRFEFVVELFWKMLKRLLASEGIETGSPKDTLKKAYSIKWIDNETAWLQMLKDRNETSHTYDEELAEKIYGHIKEYFPVLKNTFAQLKATHFKKS